MKKLSKEQVSKMMSKASKWGHQKSPRSKKHYSEIGKKGAEKRWGVKQDLSPEGLV